MTSPRRVFFIIYLGGGLVSQVKNRRAVFMHRRSFAWGRTCVSSRHHLELILGVLGVDVPELIGRPVLSAANRSSPLEEQLGTS